MTNQEVEKTTNTRENESTETNNSALRLFDGVYLVSDPRNPNKKIVATKNLTPGHRFYGETLVTRSFQGEASEFRSWDPFRSKLSAAVLNKLKYFPFSEGTSCLYLGASTGTTVSHLSDIVGTSGRIFGVEVAPRVAREFLDNVVKYRKNVVPIIADAKRPEKYTTVYRNIEIVYSDVAQPDQTDIAVTNCKTFLESGSKGFLFLVVKASSIDALRNKKEIFEEQSIMLEKCKFEILQQIDLEPYDRNHAMIVARSNF